MDWNKYTRYGGKTVGAFAEVDEDENGCGQTAAALQSTVYELFLD
jgi:hypothetical protein